MRLTQFASRCWVPDDGAFAASLRSRVLPRSLVFSGTLTTSVHRWPAPPAQHVHVGVVLRGELEIATATASTTYRQGEVYVFPRWGWVRTRVRAHLEYVHVAVPARDLTERAIDISPAALSGPVTSGLGDVLAAVAVTSVEPGPRDAATDAVVDRILVVLVQSLLAHGQDQRASASLIALRRRAEAHIEARHTDPGMRPTLLASELGVSLRQLQRAFTETGSSVASRLRERRAAHAIDLLALDSAGAASVDRVARMAGFPSAYALRSALRAATGSSPRSLRELRLRDG